MISKRSYIYILLIAGLFSDLAGQDVSVSAMFDSTRIYIGDQINFTITVDQPSDLSLKLIPLKDTLFSKIEILSGPSTDTLSAGNRLRIINKYRVTSFDSGFYQVPPVYAEMSGESGIKRFYSDYSLLEVMRVKITPPDTAAAIFDIIKPYRAPLTIGEILPWVLLAGLAAAIIWAIIRFTRGTGSNVMTQTRSPLDIAKERYARGEITKDQFEQIKRDIS